MERFGWQNRRFVSAILGKYGQTEESRLPGPDLVLRQEAAQEAAEGPAHVLVEISLLLQQLRQGEPSFWIGNPQVFLENIARHLAYYRQALPHLPQGGPSPQQPEPLPQASHGQGGALAAVRQRVDALFQEVQRLQGLVLGQRPAAFLAAAQAPLPAGGRPAPAPSDALAPQASPGEAALAPGRMGLPRQGKFPKLPYLSPSPQAMGGLPGGAAGRQVLPGMAAVYARGAASFRGTFHKAAGEGASLEGFAAQRPFSDKVSLLHRAARPLSEGPAPLEQAQQSLARRIHSFFAAQNAPSAWERSVWQSQAVQLVAAEFSRLGTPVPAKMAQPSAGGAQGSRLLPGAAGQQVFQPPHLAGRANPPAPAASVGEPGRQSAQPGAEGAQGSRLLPGAAGRQMFQPPHLGGRPGPAASVGEPGGQGAQPGAEGAQGSRLLPGAAGRQMFQPPHLGGRPAPAASVGEPGRQSAQPGAKGAQGSRLLPGAAGQQVFQPPHLAGRANPPAPAASVGEPGGQSAQPGAGSPASPKSGLPPAVQVLARRESAAPGASAPKGAGLRASGAPPLPQESAPHPVKEPWLSRSPFPQRGKRPQQQGEALVGRTALAASIGRQAMGALGDALAQQQGEFPRLDFLAQEWPQGERGTLPEGAPLLASHTPPQSAQSPLETVPAPGSAWQRANLVPGAQMISAGRGSAPVSQGTAPMMPAPVWQRANLVSGAQMISAGRGSAPVSQGAAPMMPAPAWQRANLVPVAQMALAGRGSAPVSQGTAPMMPAPVWQRANLVPVAQMISAGRGSAPVSQGAAPMMPAPVWQRANLVPGAQMISAGRGSAPVSQGTAPMMPAPAQQRANLVPGAQMASAGRGSAPVSQGTAPMMPAPAWQRANLVPGAQMASPRPAGVPGQPAELVNRLQRPQPAEESLPSRQEEPRVELRVLEKRQREQSGSLERQDQTLRSIQRQLRQQEEQLRQLASRTQEGASAAPNPKQMTDLVMRELQRQLRLERQRRGG